MLIFIGSVFVMCAAAGGVHSAKTRDALEFIFRYKNKSPEGPRKVYQTPINVPPAGYSSVVNLLSLEDLQQFMYGLNGMTMGRRPYAGEEEEEEEEETFPEYNLIDLIFGDVADDGINNVHHFKPSPCPACPMGNNFIHAKTPSPGVHEISQVFKGLLQMNNEVILQRTSDMINRRLAEHLRSVGRLIEEKTGQMMEAAIGEILRIAADIRGGESSTESDLEDYSDYYVNDISTTSPSVVSTEAETEAEPEYSSTTESVTTDVFPATEELLSSTVDNGGNEEGTVVANNDLEGVTLRPPRIVVPSYFGLNRPSGLSQPQLKPKPIRRPRPGGRPQGGGRPRPFLAHRSPMNSTREYNFSGRA